MPASGGVVYSWYEGITSCESSYHRHGVENISAGIAYTTGATGEQTRHSRKNEQRCLRGVVENNIKNAVVGSG